MVWKITNRGFLPSVDPCIELPDKHDDAETLENVAKLLPDLVANKETRKGLVGELSNIKNPLELINSFSPIELERLMMFYSYFVCKYIVS